jgi:tetratricopeptide (TPR) repeat protein
MQSLSPDEHRDLLKHLNVAIGYLGLGMAEEAWAELEAIDARHRGVLEVLKIRLEVCRALSNWELMAEIADRLHKSEPDDSGHPIDLAFAIRRVRGEDEAAAVLERARQLFPQEPMLPYNLACYRAVRGRVAEAKQLLAEAFTLDESLRLTSLDDPDLVGVWDSMGQEP